MSIWTAPQALQPDAPKLTRKLSPANVASDKEATRSRVKTLATISSVATLSTLRALGTAKLVSWATRLWENAEGGLRELISLHRSRVPNETCRRATLGKSYSNLLCEIPAEKQHAAGETTKMTPTPDLCKENPSPIETAFLYLPAPPLSMAAPVLTYGSGEVRPESNLDVDLGAPGTILSCRSPQGRLRSIRLRLAGGPPPSSSSALTAVWRRRRTPICQLTRTWPAVHCWSQCTFPMTAGWP